MNLPSVGQRAKMLIGSKWFPCKVESVDDVPHHSGQTIKCFTCRFPNGDVICCGVNSIRRKIFSSRVDSKKQLG